MKYRISEYKREGEVKFVPEGKCLFWWCEFTEWIGPMFDDEIQVCFSTYNEAVSFLDKERVKNSPFIKQRSVDYP